MSYDLSEQGAMDLLQLLLEHGYFHCQERTEPLTYIEDEHIHTWTTDDDGCTVLPTVFGIYMTLNRLDSKLIEELTILGRLSVSDAVVLLGVSEPHVRQCVDRVARDSTVIARAGDEILTQMWLNEHEENLIAFVERSHDKLAVVEVAHSWHLPLDFTLQALKPRLVDTVKLKALDNGSFVLASSTYLSVYQARVQGTFEALSQPTSIGHLAMEHGWDVSWILEWIKNDLQLKGELHGDVFTPTSYLTLQRKAVLDFFHANGYLSTDQCHSFDIRPAQMKQYAKEEVESAIVLAHIVLHPDVLVAPLEADVQEAVAGHSWVDLQAHLPADVLNHSIDVQRFMIESLLPSISDNAGLLVLSSGGAVFMSQGMIDQLAEAHVTPLIDPFAKARAKELVESKIISASVELPKEKRKGKRAPNQSQSSTSGVSPLEPTIAVDTIVQAIVAAHADLGGLDKPLLLELCQQAFVTHEFVANCERAVQSEYHRLEADRATTIKTLRKDSSSNPRDVQLSFEDPSCFANSCYVIQAMAAFIEYASEDAAGLKPEELASLKNDFLEGCCADFTRRVTEFCLFKNDIDDGNFLFVDRGGGDVLPHYCSAIDLAVRQYSRVLLNCQPDENSKLNDPLPTLRSLLPATIGTALARQWILCGNNCFQGGVKPGDLGGFLGHVEENTLIVCGLPFKKLDKKAKKQFLNARRQLLVQKLSDETDPAAVLEHAVMLLFQLVKNHVVFGSELRGTVLRLLTREKKIAEAVADQLVDAAQMLEAGGELLPEQVEAVRACALGRSGSISK